MAKLLSFLVRDPGQPKTRTRRPTEIPDDVPTTDALFLVLRRMRAPLVFIIAVFAISVIGLVCIPGKDAHGNPTHLSVFDALYFITYTATTIGFGEISEFTTPQRMWIEACIFMTVIGWAYVIGTLLSLIQSSAFQRALATQRFRTKVKRIHEPFLVVCGYGQAGRQVCQQLDAAGRRFVVVDEEPERLDRIMTDELLTEVPALTADASVPAILGLSGLSHPNCEGVLALTDDDVDNLAIVMAATVLRPNLSVIARCSDRIVEQRMRDFAPGAVINPSDRYGAYLVLAIQRPNTYRLVSWLMDPRETPLMPEYSPKTEGTWVVCAEDPFASELTNDLRRAGMKVEHVDPADGNPDLSHASGFVAGTNSDTTNLALAEHAKLDNPQTFVAVRQQSDARASIIHALAIDSVFTPTELIAQESLARVVTPLFWSFIEYAVRQPEEFSLRLLDRLASRCHNRGKDRSVIEFSQAKAPALYRWLMHDSLTVGDVLSSPDDRNEALPLVALMLIRNGEHIYAPKDSMTITPDDQLLVVGQSNGIDALTETLFSDSSAEYIATGRRVPDTWIWRMMSRSSRLGSHRSS